MRVHKIFLILWSIDLVLIPILALLDLGFSIGIESNYLARFSFMAAFILTTLHVIFSKRGGIIRNRLIFAFGIILVVGIIKGLLEGNINSSFLSHIFYVLMPIIMLSYGWHFFECYQNSHALQKFFAKLMYITFYSGLIVVSLFQIAMYLGLAVYDAIGMWNFAFCGPYLLYQKYGLIYFGLSSFGTLMSSKRGFIALYVVFLIIYGYLLGQRNRIRFLCLLLISSFVVGILLADQIEPSLSRIYRTFQALEENNYDLAFAMRWSESISALEYLGSRYDHFLVGAGFGAEFLPWPDIPDYADYYSHYTHFSVVSYIWLGGIFFSIFLYSQLISLGISLLRGCKSGLIDKKYTHFLYWLWGILIVSLSGADLMNNPYLWFIIGCCINLNKVYLSRRNLRPS